MNDPNHRHQDGSSGNHASRNPAKPDHIQQTEAHQLRREEARIAAAQRTSVADKFIQGISYLVGALELLLGLRFLLRLTAEHLCQRYLHPIAPLCYPLFNAVHQSYLRRQ